MGNKVGETVEQPIELSWDGGQLDLPLAFSESDIAETVWLLQGSRLITDWESLYPNAEASAPLEKRKQSRVATRLLELSQKYGLASREMSLVAVVTRPGDRPGELPETQVVPIGMAQDMDFGAYFAGQSLVRPPLYCAPSPLQSRVSTPGRKMGAFSLVFEDEGPPLYSRFSRSESTGWDRSTSSPSRRSRSI